MCYGISVCLRVVRRCHTRVLRIKTAKRFVEIFSQPDSPIILVFRHRGSLLNSDGFTPNGGAEYKWSVKIGRFLPIVSVGVLRNGARYGHCCRSRIGYWIPYTSYQMVPLPIIIDFPNLGITYNGGWCTATIAR